MSSIRVEEVHIEGHVGLDDYAGFPQLTGPVRELRAEAKVDVPRLGDHRVWMINSTEVGGGVAEMMPRLILLLRSLGVDTKWAVMRGIPAEFFTLTKALHNAIHGQGDGELGQEEIALYQKVSRACAESLRPQLRPDDILVIHDPQPLGMGALLKDALGLHTIWRCHIGLEDLDSPAAAKAWSFLEPYAAAYDHSIFSAPEYIRGFLAGRASVMRPSLDPLSHKNRDLPPHKLVGVLCNAGLMSTDHPLMTPPFPKPALRLRPNGDFARVSDSEDIGLLFRPVITQVSRWDRLKGFVPLLQGFLALKRRAPHAEPRHRQRLEALRLVLAGPNPESIQDDPEGQEVLAELRAAYQALDARSQADVAILTLPLDSVKHNALTVNALQRCSTVVVQNSLREGFGLTITEAMWKAIPVMGTHAWGLRQQIRDGLDGRLVQDPTDPEAIAQTLDEMLRDPRRRFTWGLNGQRRVYEEFLVFDQLRAWLRVLGQVASGVAMAPLPERHSPAITVVSDGSLSTGG